MGSDVSPRESELLSRDAVFNDRDDPAQTPLSRWIISVSRDAVFNDRDDIKRLNQCLIPTRLSLTCTFLELIELTTKTWRMLSI